MKWNIENFALGIMVLIESIMTIISMVYCFKYASDYLTYGFLAVYAVMIMIISGIALIVFLLTIIRIMKRRWFSNHKVLIVSANKWQGSPDVSGLPLSFNSL